MYLKMFSNLVTNFAPFAQKKIIFPRLQSIVEAHFIYLLFISCMFRLHYTSLIHVVSLCMLTILYIYKLPGVFYLFFFYSFFFIIRSYCI